MAADTVAKLILAEPAIESDTDGTIVGTMAEDGSYEGDGRAVEHGHNNRLRGLVMRNGHR